MFHRHSHRLRLIVASLIALFLWAGQPQAKGQSTSPSLDLFSGLNFNFRDINFNTQYEFLIRLSPGFKWNMGNHWQMNGQLLIPILNQYEDVYKYVDLRALNVSKEFRVRNLHLKPTVGAFSHNRYGLDLKAFLPLCDWFALEGQAGYVGWLFVFPEWWIGRPNTFVWTAGGDFYLPKWNTQFRCTIGKYLYQDFGGEVEAMRHFNHTSVSVYGRWNDINGFDGGFRFVIALPPYHRKHKTVNIRPASNFRLSYMVMYHINNNRMYTTDPEENERDGWFSRDFLLWGSHNMAPDFIITEKTKTNETN